MTDSPSVVNRILAAERAVLRLERSAVLNWLSRLALGAAVLSNADKAAAVFASRSETGAWSPWALAIGLEAALSVSSYALADRVQRNARLQPGERQPAAALWIVVGVFAAISTVANVRYFATHGEGALGLAVVFGLAAPAIALANAFLTGDVAGADEARAEQRQEHQAHLATLQLEAQIAAHTASAERARARAAQVSTPARTAVRDVRPDRPDRLVRMDALLSAVRQEPDASVRRLAELSGLSKSTVGDYLQDLAEAGRIQKNGHGWEVR